MQAQDGAGDQCDRRGNHPAAGLADRRLEDHFPAQAAQSAFHRTAVRVAGLRKPRAHSAVADAVALYRARDHFSAAARHPAPQGALSTWRSGGRRDRLPIARDRAYALRHQPPHRARDAGGARHRARGQCRPSPKRRLHHRRGPQRLAPVRFRPPSGRDALRRPCGGREYRWACLYGSVPRGRRAGQRDAPSRGDESGPDRRDRLLYRVHKVEPDQPIVGEFEGFGHAEATFASK